MNKTSILVIQARLKTLESQRGNPEINGFQL